MINLYRAHSLDLPRKFESGTALGVRVHAPCWAIQLSEQRSVVLPQVL